MTTPHGGYSGSFLHIDLASGNVAVEDTPDPMRWLGSRGWNALVGWHDTGPGMGPFAPENPIVISAGPLVGTGAPTAGRITVSTVGPRGYPRPLWSSGSMGGYLGAELKYAGYDGIIIRGRASAPCYLLIEDGVVRIEEARDLWGQGVFATQRILKERHGVQHQVAAIGPAGENRVRYASIIHRLANAIGNAGFGGVMGSKNLKAVAVRGTGGVPIADPVGFVTAVSRVWELARGGVACLGQPDQGYPVVACTHGCSVRCGTRVQATHSPSSGDVRVRMLKCQNGAFVRGSHPGYDGVSADGVRLVIPRPPGLGEAGLGLGNLVEDLGLTAWFYDSWYRYFGGLRELGVTEIAGEPLALDDPTWWRRTLGRVARREGIGDDMAEGLIRFHDRHGIGPRYLVEFIESAGSRGHGWHRDGRAMEPHPSPFWEHAALLYATSTRDVTPSTHGFFFLNRLYGYPSAPPPPESVPAALQALGESVYGSREAVWAGDSRVEHVTAWHQHRAAIKDSLGLCDWVFPVLNRTFATREELVSAVAAGDGSHIGDPAAEALLYASCTGIDLPMAAMESPLAERIVNLERCLDIRNTGRSREDDETVIPHFQWPEKTDSTRVAPDADKFRALLDRYYDLRGWDRRSGRPTRTKLEELELASVVGEWPKTGA